MTKIMKVSLFLATLMFAGASFAADHGPGKGRMQKDRMHQRGPDMGMQVIEHLGKALRRLDLSEEQKESIHADMKGLREELKPLVKEIHQGRKELHGLITADSYDADAAAAIAEQQGELTTQVTMTVSQVAARRKMESLDMEIPPSWKRNRIAENGRSQAAANV